MVGTAEGRLHIDLWLDLLLSRMIPLGLRAIIIIPLYYITKVQAVLDGWCADLLLDGRIGGICPEVLQLLGLLHLLHALAAEVLQVPQTAIVLDIVADGCQILLLVVWGPNRLVHDIQVRRVRLGRIGYVLEVIKL